MCRAHDDDDNVGGEANVKARAEKKEREERIPRRLPSAVAGISNGAEFRKVGVRACVRVVHRRARTRCVGASIGAHTCGGHLALEI